MASFLLQSSFFRTIRPLASSEATAYYQPAPGRTDGIPEREIKDNGYKSVFTNSWLVRQRNRSWIKGLGKNPQKSWQLPNREPTDSEKRLRVYKSSAMMACHAWYVDKAPTKTHKNRNARLDALRSAVPKKNFMFIRPPM